MGESGGGGCGGDFDVDVASAAAAANSTVWKVEETSLSHSFSALQFSSYGIFSNYQIFSVAKPPSRWGITQGPSLPLNRRPVNPAHALLYCKCNSGKEGHDELCIGVGKYSDMNMYLHDKLDKLLK